MAAAAGIETGTGGSTTGGVGAAGAGAAATGAVAAAGGVAFGSSSGFLVEGTQSRFGFGR